jgi:hypothetical protein
MPGGTRDGLTEIYPLPLLPATSALAPATPISWPGEPPIRCGTRTGHGRGNAPGTEEEDGSGTKERGDRRSDPPSCVSGLRPVRYCSDG